jgi:PAS domain S-box-containing protein
LRGRNVGAISGRRDALSDQNRIDDALQESNERYRLLIENVRDHALFMLDPEGRVSSWGRGAQDVFGYAADEIVGQPASILFTPEDRAAGVPEAELRTAREHKSASDDRWQLRRGGERFWASGTTTSMRDAGGAVRGFVKVCRDLTTKKLLDEQRDHLLSLETAARSEAEAANRAKDEFLAVLSHELRTPLAPILLWTRELRAGSVPPESWARALDAIIDSAESQVRLIDDLLDLSRITSGRLELLRAVTDVEKLARGAWEMLRPAADAKGIAFSCEVNEKGLAAFLDAHRVRQVLWNLLSNAVKFTPEGGRIALRVGREGSQLVMEVRDNGIGIDPGFLPHVFERFRQQDMRDSRAFSGLGIGLALARQIVELHGGTVEARSEGHDKGAVFTVRIPIIDAPHTPVFPAEVGLPSPDVRGLSVLVVEDHVATRLAMEAVLELAGATVRGVANGPAALKALEGEDRPEVMVCDIGLPGMDGYELIQKAAQLYRSRGMQPIPAVAVSAHVRDIDRRRAIDAGFDLYLAKPASSAQLLDAVAELSLLRNG